MRKTSIFIFEWKHFIQSPFKIIALLLFIIAGIYGLHNGANLYEKQQAEVSSIEEKIEKQKQETIALYKSKKKGPEGKPWIDLTTPFWAIRNVATYHFKRPSSTMVYSIGQAEQYAFYKKITTWSSPYDNDMTEEIANPERLQLGTLDFSFVALFLIPLLLLILVYNIKGTEVDLGFLSLIYVQINNKNQWLFIRILFYTLLVIITTMVLMIYGGFLTDVFNNDTLSFWKIFGLLSAYCLLWTIIYALILLRDNNSIINTLKMIGVWILLSFIIPASVHQWVSINHPTNLMVDLIDAQRDQTNQLFDEPTEQLQEQLIKQFPTIKNSPVYQDSILKKKTIRRSVVALANELVKKSLKPVELENNIKNNIIANTYWFNPLTCFQNNLNSLTKTQYANYKNYRTEIQNLIDRQINYMIIDSWENQKVDKDVYLKYYNTSD